MQQLPVPFAEKLDEPLAQLCNDGRGLARSARVPVLVQVQGTTLAAVAARVRELGGTIRHHLELVSAIAAWIPLDAIERLATDETVQHMELEQSCSVA